MHFSKKKFIYRTPRILGVLFVCFLMLFSFDVIQPGLSWQEIALGMLIHNIPAFVLLIVLLIAWKHEIVGGIVFFLAAFLYIFLTNSGGIPWYLALSWSMIISGPALFIGFLFFLGRDQKRKLRKLGKTHEKY